MRRHAAGDVLLDLLLEMEMELAVELRIDAVLLEDRAEPQTSDVEPAVKHRNLLRRCAGRAEWLPTDAPIARAHRRVARGPPSSASRTWPRGPSRSAPNRRESIPA